MTSDGQERHAAVGTPPLLGAAAEDGVSHPRMSAS